MVAISGTSWFTLASVATVLFATVTNAHLSMTVSKAVDNTYLTTAVRVPHGCQSANGSPTRAITVTLPAGVMRAQFENIAGWNITTESEAVDPPVTMGSSQITSRVKTVRWEGGPLPQGQYKDFGMRIFLPAAKDDSKSELIFFPVLQECETGRDLWNQIPDTEGYNHELQRDAPHIEINTHPDDTPWTENRLVKGQTSTASVNVVNSGSASLLAAAVAAHYLI
ncbi:uncharacterized protein ATC70_004327 [Mucor velutinosus]|uniref:YncI copper-binding domain-containing protein n=1 Tax=Mucor velutinosus TaxID=708070 RepID=A0AAN7DQZ3_9FUNG|nr:hypothetical protein ATC70_004327 [Mucor velutinosus]